MIAGRRLGRNRKMNGWECIAFNFSKNAIDGFVTVQ